jgi:hypothetical protein
MRLVMLTILSVSLINLQCPKYHQLSVVVADVSTVVSNDLVNLFVVCISVSFIERSLLTIGM